MKRKLAVYGIGNYATMFIKWLEYRKIDATIVFFIQSVVDTPVFADKPVWSCESISDEFEYLILAVSDKYISSIKNNLESLPIYREIKSKLFTIDEFKKEMGFADDVPIEIIIDYTQEKIEHIGSDYGGYWIDISKLSKKPTVLSFGVGEEVSFDLEMIRRFGARVYAFDPTPKAITYMEQCIDNEQIEFYPIGISSTDGETFFYLPKNKDYVSGAEKSRDELETEPIVVEMKCFSSVVSVLGGIRNIDVLKMDIEGSEFDVIPTILENEDVCIKQLLVEFHDRFYPDGIAKKNKIIKMLFESGYVVVHEDKSECTMTFAKGK